ncbi:hypothetical protein DRO61_06125, partial [Candidatus Bathyarchaeota archaeon]
SYQSHQSNCNKLGNPYKVVYSSGWTGTPVQAFPTKEDAIKAINEREPTGKYIDLGDVTPSLDHCDFNDEEETCPEGQVLKFNTSIDDWECVPVGNGGNGGDDDSDDGKGCMDENATNYDPDATEDDSSCKYEGDDEGSNLNTIFLVGALAIAGFMIL